MSYSTSNPPRLVTQGIAGLRVWEYASTDASTVVDASGYFTNGYDLGMRAGDSVRVVDTDASPVAVTMHTVNVSGTTIDLSDGVSIGSTNSD
jgi:hypothetical protein